MSTRRSGGNVVEAIAISGIELINQWYYGPAYRAITQNYADIQIGGVVVKHHRPNGGNRVYRQPT